MFSKRRKNRSPLVVQKVTLSDNPTPKTATYGAAVIDRQVEIHVKAGSPHISKVYSSASDKRGPK
ncbi:hypothetical protein ABEY41_19780 [Peribacillus butanolivorans]|uniref:hypothetical protein n=1 Tax=Peribacillus TaxID=2675229 RepID=UPI00191307ED|nr:hypothetical protein [Peribacillus sp. TH24]MBK5443250.1 hypothetical protein [Peribacillus sp. TH24]